MDPNTYNNQQATGIEPSYGNLYQAPGQASLASAPPGVPQGQPILQPNQASMQGQASVQPGMPQQSPAQPPKVAPKTNPNSTQNILQIAEIRDGIAIMNDGSFRSVVMAKSINFDLMSGEEKEAIEFGYQGFLNSLYFPIQIFIRSTKVDLRPYLERLDKIRREHDNMLLALLMEDYLGYIENLSYEANIMDKRFYIVIPYFPVADVQRAITQSKNFFSGLKSLFGSVETHVTINEQNLNAAKDELRNRVQAVLGGLNQAGVQGLPLDTQELIELYYDTYNPDTATRQQLRDFSDISTPIVMRGDGIAPQPNLDRSLQ